MSQPDAIVVGGGLAGIAAAARLADGGARVLLLESRPRLGGATYSFRRGELTVDTGQHVFLRCYREYLALLSRLGTRHGVRLADRFDVTVLAPGRPPHRMRRAVHLPAPAHLLPALLGYRPLSVRERIGAVRAAVALRGLDPDAPGLDTHSLGEFFAHHRQTPATVRRLWELIAVAALNVDPDHASLALAARVFRTGLLSSASAGDIGRPTMDLASLHGDAAARVLPAAGVEVRTRAKVTAVEPVAGGYRVHAGDERHAARAVVLAVPHPAAAALVPPGAVADPGRWAGLSATAIVNVHLVYDRPVTGLGFAAAVDSPAQWIFDRTAESGLARGQYLAVSLSAADALVRRPAAELIDEQRAALTELLPAAGRGTLTEAFVTREPRATFRQAPGTRRLRPSAVTALPGLALAGAWTDTGWPDTMEGAVVSGHRAADVARAALDTPGAGSPPGVTELSIVEASA